MTKEEIKKWIRENNISDIIFQFTDIAGNPKGPEVSSSKFESIIADGGATVDASSIEGLAREEEGDDMFAKPDKTSFYLLPWRKNNIGNVGCCICDIHIPNGSPFDGDPRYVLKKTLKKAKDIGYQYIVAPEYEFFLFLADEKGQAVFKDGRPIPIDTNGYFDIDGAGTECLRTIIYTLKKMGINADKAHHEVAPGQYEIGIPHGPALDIADQIMMIKITTKAIAKKFGFYASDMPKPLEDDNGSGMHFHQNLIDKNGNNIFFNDKEPSALSEKALYFLAGQLEHIDEILPILASHVNSYKRLVPNFEAPVYKTWANSNRSSLIRVPSFKPKSARIELRCADPECNPYLVFSALLEAGLRGIKEKILPPKSIEKNLFKMSQEERSELSIMSLSQSLEKALEYYKTSKLVKNTLGKHAFKMFLNLKEKECNFSNTSVNSIDFKMSF
ncbi:glutamine synthetase family protein [Patescibacteria group bacterium]